jgi:autotransporter-associated beta strand protein
VYAAPVDYSGTIWFSTMAGNPKTVSFTINQLPSAPSVSDFAENLDVGGTLTFAAADFTGAFTDPNNGALQKVMITALPQYGVLDLGSTAVALDQEIPVALLGTLSYTPGSNSTGLDTFGWNGSDGSLYAVAGATVHLTVDGVWTATGGGTFSWGSGGNWQSGVVPCTVGGAALFGSSVGSGAATITLDAARTLSSLTFSPGAGGSYAISGSNSLQFANSGSSASISVASGSDAINAPLVLGDNLNVTAAGGTSLTISGPISQSGGSHGLTLSGSGCLTLSNPNTYSGGTTINGGVITATSSASVPPGGAVVFVGGNLVLNFGAGGGSVTADASASAADILQAGAGETAPSSNVESISAPTQTASLIGHATVTSRIDRDSPSPPGHHAQQGRLPRWEKGIIDGRPLSNQIVRSPTQPIAAVATVSNTGLILLRKIDIA